MPVDVKMSLELESVKEQLETVLCRFTELTNSQKEAYKDLNEKLLGRQGV